MNSQRCLLLFPLVLFGWGSTVVNAESGPAPLWVARVPEESLPAFVEAGGCIRDRFPDALVLDDATSARLVSEHGHRLWGPFEVDDEVFLLRRRGPHAPAAGAGDRLREAGLSLLWEDGRNFLVATPRGLPDVLPGRLSAKHLSPSPLPAASAIAAGGTPAVATTFDPLIDGLVAQVDSMAYFPWIRRLAGADAVTVGGAGLTFTTRWTHASQCRSAEQYVLERFQAMGFTDVTYDPFPVGSTTARNVVATLPGETTPERVYLLTGHLDSTSQQASTNAPGANDNASGIAAVLAIAEILKDQKFDSTIRFVAFTGEEQGLYGSTHYADQALASGEDIRGVVNCDMIAWYGTHYRIDIEGLSFANPLMQLMNDACNTYTGLATALIYTAWGSDHVPFLNRGIPAFLAIESDYAYYPCYHWTCDTADQNDASFGVEVTRACLATVAHLAGILPPPPTGVPSVDRRLDTLTLFPNPFRAGTVVRWTLAAPGPVRLSVHDVRGRLVRTLTEGPRAGGRHEVTWNGRSGADRSLPAGIYFVRLESPSVSRTARAVRLP